MTKPSLPRRILRLFALIVLAFVALSFVSVLLLRWLDPPTSAFIVRDRVTVWLSKDRAYPLQHQWVDWPRIAAPMKVAVIASEDQTFPEHYGFDLKSIDKALDERSRGRRVRGASTISQQVAKNLFLWPGRSWVRKGFEAYFTVLIELMWPKQRILEVYLNIAEFGRGVFGAEAASKAFFRKPASKLTSADAALLAAVLPNPQRLKVQAPSRYVRSRQAWIMAQMRRLGGSTVLHELD